MTDDRSPQQLPALPTFVCIKKFPDATRATVGLHPGISQNTFGNNRAEMDTSDSSSPKSRGLGTPQEPQAFAISTEGAHFFVPSNSAAQSEKLSA